VVSLVNGPAAQPLLDPRTSRRPDPASYSSRRSRWKPWGACVMLFVHSLQRPRFSWASRSRSGVSRGDHTIAFAQPALHGDTLPKGVPSSTGVAQTHRRCFNIDNFLQPRVENSLRGMEIPAGAGVRNSTSTNMSGRSNKPDCGLQAQLQCARGRIKQRRAVAHSLHKPSWQVPAHDATLVPGRTLRLVAEDVREDPDLLRSAIR